MNKDKILTKADKKELEELDKLLKEYKDLIKRFKSV